MRTSSLQGLSLVLAAHRLPGGGLPRVMAIEAVALAAHSYDVQICIYDGGIPPYYVEMYTGVDLRLLCERGGFHMANLVPNSIRHWLGSSGFDVALLAPKRVSAHLKREAPDVVICHEVASSVLALPYLIPSRTPFITVLHDDPFSFLRFSNSDLGLPCQLLGSIPKRLAAHALHRSAEVIATTSRIAERVREVTNPRSLKVLEYGFDPPRRSTPYDARHIVLTVSKWSESRHPKVYLDIAARIPSGVPFVIAGHWDSIEALGKFRHEVEERGLSSRVVIQTDLTDAELAKLYNDAKLFVRFGYSEYGTGEAALEAISYGVPVLVNSNLGIADLVTDGVHGRVLSDENLSAAPEVARAMVLDDEGSRCMSERCQQLAANHTWKAYTEALANAVAQASGRC